MTEYTFERSSFFVQLISMQSETGSLPSGSVLFFATGLEDDLRLPMIDYVVYKTIELVKGGREAGNQVVGGVT